MNAPEKYKRNNRTDLSYGSEALNTPEKYKRNNKTDLSCDSEVLNAPEKYKKNNRTDLSSDVLFKPFLKKLFAKVPLPINYHILLKVIFRLLISPVCQNEVTQSH